MSQLKGFAAITKGLSRLSPEAEPDVSPVKVAKTRNPLYRRTMVLVQKATEKKAWRKYEDSHEGKDFSDLVDSLLAAYVDGDVDV